MGKGPHKIFKKKLLIHKNLIFAKLKRPPKADEKSIIPDSSDSEHRI